MLDTQLETLKFWAARERPGRGTPILSDIGSGLNAERKGLQKLIALCQSNGRLGATQYNVRAKTR